MMLKNLSYRIKHLGTFLRRSDKGIELRVHPTLIPEDELIANVNGVKKCCFLSTSQCCCPTLYQGAAGAGSQPFSYDEAILFVTLFIQKMVQNDSVEADAVTLFIFPIFEWR